MTNDEKQGDTALGEEGMDLPWLQPAEDDDEAETWLSTRTLVIGAGIFIVVFIGLLWVTYNAISNEDETIAVTSGEPALIMAPAEPYKIAPEDPGGAEIPDRDKMVLEAAEGDVVEPDATLGAWPQDPVERDADAGGFVNGTEAEAELTQDDARQTALEAEPAPVVKEDVQISAPTANGVAVKGRYLLQLGAFSSEQRARVGWDEIQMKYPKYIGDLSIDTQMASINGKTIYRLRGAAIATRAEADGRCAALKAIGQGCLVIER